MSDKRIVVWVQAFHDRTNLMLQWHDPATGRKKSKSAGTPDPVRAEELRGDLEADLNAGRHRQPARMAWARFREHFEADYLPGVRSDSRKAYRACLDRAGAAVVLPQLGQVDARLLTRLVTALRNQEYDPRTVRNTLTVLRTALSWAVSQKWLVAVPEFPKVKVPKKRPQPVAEADFLKLVAAAGDDLPLQGVLLAGWYAGLRLKEACLLEWEPTDEAMYLDLVRDRIVFPAEIVKGDEDQWVSVAPELRALIDRLPRSSARVFDLRSVSPKKRLRGGPLGKVGLSARIVQLAARAGVPLTMQTLRRGFGCRHAPRVPAQVLQRLMRHKDIRITMDYYANVDAAAEAAIKGNIPGNT